MLTHLLGAMAVLSLLQGLAGSDANSGYDASGGRASLELEGGIGWQSGP